ncbi:MAG: V-type ATPase subunit [Promethearchaeota archaeon]
MRIVVPSYTYTLIKIVALKNIEISPEEYKALRRIKDEHKLLNLIDRYFPEISKIKDINVVNIEKALFSIYFKIYEKILVSSPGQMQIFLKALLNRYEIWNIKTYIVGMLANMSIEDIRREILIEPEKTLQRMIFIDKLLLKTNFKDGISYLEKSKYAKIIQQGVHFYEEKKEIFLLEALLDKFFHTQLLNSLDNYSGVEKKLFNNYIDTLIQKYNLILTFRSVRNNVPKVLLKQLIIPKGNVFNPELITALSLAEDTEEYFQKMTNFLKRNIFLKSLVKKLTLKDPISPILSELNHNLFRDIKSVKTEDIDLDAITIEKILTFVFNKENEIFRVLSLFIKILHEIKD